MNACSQLGLNKWSCGYDVPLARNDATRIHLGGWARNIALEPTDTFFASLSAEEAAAVRGSID
jgi:hypothetical protein